MLADQFTVVACYCQNRIIALVSHVVLCCSDHFALVFVQCPPPGPHLSFESREEGAGGYIPLQNSESLSAVHILNPLCQWYMHIHLNCLFNLCKYTLPSFMQTVSKQLLGLFFLPLQKTAMPLETVARSAAPPRRVCVWTALAPPTCPVTAGS